VEIRLALSLPRDELSIPVVRKTGGLADTIENLSDDGSTGNGFMFEHYTGEAFLSSLKRSVETYQNQSVWRPLVARATLDWVFEQG